MLKSKPNHSALIILYICILLLSGFYLLLNRNFLMNYTTTNKLPLGFLLHFGIFWFISFMLSLFFYAVHIRMHQYSFSSLEIAQASKFGILIFTVGASMAVTLGILFYTLT